MARLCRRYTSNVHFRNFFEISAVSLELNRCEIKSEIIRQVSMRLGQNGVIGNVILEA